VVTQSFEWVVLARRISKDDFHSTHKSRTDRRQWSPPRLRQSIRPGRQVRTARNRKRCTREGGGEDRCGLKRGGVTQKVLEVPNRALLHPQLCTPYPQPCTLHPQPCTLGGEVSRSKRRLLMSATSEPEGEGARASLATRETSHVNDSSSCRRESSLLTTYWSESTTSSRCLSRLALRHGSLNSLFHVA
jgi:hypothetical protein